MKTELKGITVAALAVLLATAAAADDGAMFRKNVSKTPDLDTEHATVKMFKFYVASQNSAGELVPAEYCLPDEDTGGEICSTTLDYAKPLVAFYHDGEVVHVPDVGFPGHGRKDVFGAVSLDDGATWKRTNLSNSSDLSSFTLGDGTDYPGDTFRLFANAAGNKVMVAWASRYCRSGSPLYSWTDDEKDAFLAFLEGDGSVDWDYAARYISVDGAAEDYELYTDDLFSVAGAQGSIDFADEEYPTVGEVPYACLWAARGTVEPASLNSGGQLKYDPAGTLKTVVWRKAERLTSGRRDVHRVEVQAAEGAGFIVTWQEDPEGLRPGKGEGPGEGWSGAIAHQQTDIWYSYVPWGHFDKVCTDDVADAYCTPGELLDWHAAQLDGAPKTAVPMAMPVRITDNAMCKFVQTLDDEGNLVDPYCYADFDSSGTADLCAGEFSWTNPGGTTLGLCETEDGRVMDGLTAATRARDKLLPYDIEDDDAVDGAWVMLAYEEKKGLGTVLLDPDDPENPADIGKNVWYHSFDMFNPDFGAQGGLLNQPAVDWNTGTFFEFIEVGDAYPSGSLFYDTEIARRASLIAQPLSDKVINAQTKTLALVLYKQGIINQGGPADVFGRFFRLPDDFPTAGFDPVEDNPFAFENMVCDATLSPDGEGWAFTDGSNTNYVRGVCKATPINLSATTLLTCDTDCTELPGDLIDPVTGDTIEIPRALTWAQCPAGNLNYTCATDETNLDDQSWENPLDVAKGHRGFMEGDFIMMMYGWSPNWKANSVGHDHNNIYVRRSFDGGLTWTTTPAGWGPGWAGDDVVWNADGTTSCEIFRTDTGGLDIDNPVCTFYETGADEPARNVSLLLSKNLTILDPRFTSTKGDTSGCDEAEDAFCIEPVLTDDLRLTDDRDASKFFVTYQTGDNTTVAETEATPLDMYYSRAVNWGDEYVVMTDPADAGGDTTCLGTDIYKEDPFDGYCMEFDWLENKKAVHSAEAALQSNPAGIFLYAIWDQWKEDQDEIPYESDAIHRRVWFIDDGTSTDPPDPEDPPGPGGGSSGPGGRP
jgi:hypothetical protein